MFNGSSRKGVSASRRFVQSKPATCIYLPYTKTMIKKDLGKKVENNWLVEAMSQQTSLGSALRWTKLNCVA